MSATLSSHFVSPSTWAKANGYGYKVVLEFLRRQEDPMPHVRRGRRYLIDDELSVDWLRRNFGVNCGVVE